MSKEAPLFISTDPRIERDKDGNILKRDWSLWAQEHRDFAARAQSSLETQPMHDVEKDIAEWWFHRHVKVPVFTSLTGLAVRPFWRDGKQTPPLTPHYSAWPTSDV